MENQTKTTWAKHLVNDALFQKDQIFIWLITGVNI